MGNAITGKNHPLEEQLAVPESNFLADSSPKTAGSESVLARKAVDWSQRMSHGYGTAVEGVKSTAHTIGEQVKTRPFLSAAIAGVVGGALGYALACRARD